MRVLTRLETALTWVQSVALGLAFGAFWVLSQRLLFAHGWGETLASGVLASALYGAIVGWPSRRIHPPRTAPPLPAVVRLRDGPHQRRPLNHHREPRPTDQTPPTTE